MTQRATLRKIPVEEYLAGTAMMRILPAGSSTGPKIGRSSSGRSKRDCRLRRSIEGFYEQEIVHSPESIGALTKSRRVL